MWFWLLIVLALAVSIPTLLMWGFWNGYMPRMMDMMGYGWGFMSLIAIVFLTLVALGAYYLITTLIWQGRHEARDTKRPLEILKERYARGAITKEQYLEMKKELE